MPILNIGTSRETSVNDLVRVLGEIAGRPLDARYGPGKPGEQRRSALDAGLAKRVLGWEPATDLKTGLAATFAWFQQQHGTPRP
jgi:UDP-glucose 4-epimerase